MIKKHCPTVNAQMSVLSLIWYLLPLPSTHLALESESCSVLSDSLQLHGLYRPWNSPGQDTGVGSLSLLQGIFPTQGSNPGVPHCRRILYQLSHEGRLWKLCPYLKYCFVPVVGFLLHTYYYYYHICRKRS